MEKGPKSVRARIPRRNFSRLRRVAGQFPCNLWKSTQLVTLCSCSSALRTRIASDRLSKADTREREANSLLPPIGITSKQSSFNKIHLLQKSLQLFKLYFCSSKARKIWPLKHEIIDFCRAHLVARRRRESVCALSSSSTSWRREEQGMAILSDQLSQGEKQQPVLRKKGRRIPYCHPFELH